jgi:ferric-dicitrate binding protein FerR (iron transport regulator)
MPDSADLFTRWELGLADAADEAVLAELLRNPAQRRAFARQARIAAALARQTEVVLTSPRRLHRPPARIRRRPFVWALAASLLAAIGLAVVLLQPRLADTTARLLVASDGSRGKSVTGNMREIHAGVQLEAGETVIAGRGSVTLTLAHAAARFDLAAGTRLRLPTAESDRGPLRLDLDSGRIQAEVAPRPADAALSITTPQGRAEVVGTRFVLTTDAGSTRLDVTAGTVRLSAAEGSSLLVGPGQTAFAAAGLAGPAPPAAGTDAPLPNGSRVLWRMDAREATGWNAALDLFADGPAWRSVPVHPDDRWGFAEVRSPISQTPWQVESGTWLRFRYWTNGFPAERSLRVHIKPADETNYAANLLPETTPGWHQAKLRLDRDFHHIGRQHEVPPVGTFIHGVVWSGQRAEDDPIPAARFWIRDAVVFVND